MDYALGLSAVNLFRQLSRRPDGESVDMQAKADLEAQVAGTVSAMLLACGGLVPEGQAPGGRWFGPVVGATDQFGVAHGTLPVVRTGTWGGNVSRRSVGYRELTEGIGRAVECIRLRADSPTLQDLVRETPDGQVLLATADPYWVAYAHYLQTLATTAAPGPTLQEFVCVAETALMLGGDLAFTDAMPGWLRDSTTQHANTFTAFASMCRHLGGGTSVRLDDTYSVDAWIEFQEQLLRLECGHQASFEELTVATLDGLQLVEEHQRRQGGAVDLARRVADVYQRSARLNLETRLEYVRGTSPTPLLLGTWDEVADAFLALVPAFSVGSYLVGDPELITAVAHLRLIRDASEVGLFGDAPCPWHTGYTRSCAEPHQALCGSTAGFAGAAPCGRQKALQALVADSPDDDLAWISAGRHGGPA